MARAIETPRLVLREWRDSDVAPFAVMSADPRVMEYFPCVLTPAESGAFIGRIKDSFATRGFGLWALERKDSGDFIGFTGLWVPRFEAAFTPCVEIGWRLAQEHRGHGFAPEAARAALADGFGRLLLEEVLSFTAFCNTPSRRVMEKIGMRHVADGDFIHPNIADDARLNPHVLYRITSRDFKGAHG